MALLTGNAYELIAELKVQGYLMPFWTEQAAITFALAKVEAGRNVQRLTEGQSNIRPVALKPLVAADARRTEAIKMGAEMNRQLDQRKRQGSSNSGVGSSSSGKKDISPSPSSLLPTPVSPLRLSAFCVNLLSSCSHSLLS